MDKTDYKFDVAFSFVDEDEGLAIAINDLLRDRLATFLYSERQKEIAGTDGEETFSKVFGEEARIVVVLYREKWGKTPWTRIEETAIRNRAFNEGYDFVIFVPVEKDISPPKWLPKNRLWIGLSRWGEEGAASVIEARVQEAGGEPKEESVEDRALRLTRQMEAETKRKEFLNSEAGVNKAAEESERLFGLIEELAKRIGEDTKLGIRTTRVKRGMDICATYGCLEVDWFCRFTNSLSDAHLRVQLWDGVPPRPGRMFFENPTRLQDMRLSFDRDYIGTIGWRISGEGRLFTSERLAEECLKILLDYTHDEHRERNK